MSKIAPANADPEFSKYLAQQRALSARTFAGPAEEAAARAASKASYPTSNAPGSSWSRSQLVRAGFWLSMGFGVGGFLLAVVAWLFSTFIPALLNLRR
jgi:hypothetical protein